MRSFATGKRVFCFKTAGLTLIEIVVAIGVFVMLLALVGGTYLTMVRIQGEQFQVQHVIGDIDNFFDILDREIRTGYGNTFEEQGGVLELVNQHGDCVEYKLAGGGIQRTQFEDWNSVARSCSGSITSTTSITSRRTNIEELSFVPVQETSVETVDNQEVTWGRQGRVTVFVGACPEDLDVTSWRDDGRCVATQTTVTSRQFSAFTP